ncbi:unnamed protein product [Rotaria magnacalcarata]|uniref:Kinesin light chain n=2 Tax=Rotaria magnacalcarata TaxID=392030 RepID=A0A816U2G7_9BILA|nr:unnamed protein product [Rotaria magnacalcarata]
MTHTGRSAGPVRSRKNLAGCISAIGWYRLGKRMYKIGHFNHAEELYNELFNGVPNDNDRAHIYHMLRILKLEQGEYKQVALFYEKSLEVKRKTLPQDHSSLATTCSNIDGLYGTMCDYSKALEYYNKAHKIQETVLPPNHSDLAFCYNNIALLYKDMGDYSKALEFCTKSFKIREITLPSDHPLLATSYNNIGKVYDSMGDYSKALEFYKKLL